MWAARGHRKIRLKPAEVYPRACVSGGIRVPVRRAIRSALARDADPRARQQPRLWPRRAQPGCTGCVQDQSPANGIKERLAKIVERDQGRDAPDQVEPPEEKQESVKDRPRSLLDRSKPAQIEKGQDERELDKDRENECGTLGAILTGEKDTVCRVSCDRFRINVSAKTA